MGTILSSNNDYNSVLARQPRTSIDIPKFEPPRSFQQQPRADSFIIPVPVHISQTKNRSENVTPTLPNEPPVVNEHFKPPQTSIQLNPSSPIESANLSSVINNQTQQKPKEEQPQQQIIERSPSYFVRSDLPLDHQTMNSEAAIISRSIINLYNRRHLKNHRYVSSQPYRTIVERNGKQFLVEFQERIERRYIQCFDETTHRMRFFEVIDRIPCRIIRPYRHKSQSLLQNNISQNTFLPTLQSNQRPDLPPIPNDRSEIVAPSSSIDNRNLNNRGNLTGAYDLQRNTINMPSTKKTSKKMYYESSTNPSQPQPRPFPRLTTRSAADSIYNRSQYSESGSLKFSPIDSQNASDQYSSKLFRIQPQSFRTHTPTISNGSVSSSAADSFDSDEETEMENNEDSNRILRSNESRSSYKQRYPVLFNNRNNTEISYGTITDGHNSPTPLDPFARSQNPGDRHHYRKRPTINNYAEPVVNNRRFQQSAPDYAPIPIVVRQPNLKPYSRPHNLNNNFYDG